MKITICLIMFCNLFVFSSCKERVNPISQAKFVRSGTEQDNIFVTSVGAIEPKLRTGLTEQMKQQLGSLGFKFIKLEFILSTVVRSNGVLSESVPTFLVSDEDMELKIGSILPSHKVLLFECAFDDGIDDDSSLCELKSGREVVGKSYWGSHVNLMELCSVEAQGCKLMIMPNPDEKSSYKLSLQSR